MTQLTIDFKLVFKKLLSPFLLLANKSYTYSNSYYLMISLKTIARPKTL